MITHAYVYWFLLSGALLAIALHVERVSDYLTKSNPNEIDFAGIWKFGSVLGLVVGIYLYKQNPLLSVMPKFVTTYLEIIYHIFIVIAIYFVGAYVMDKIIRFILRK